MRQEPALLQQVTEPLVARQVPGLGNRDYVKPSSIKDSLSLPATDKIQDNIKGLSGKELSQLRSNLAILESKITSGNNKVEQAIDIVAKASERNLDSVHGKLLASLVDDLAKIYVVQGKTDTCSPTRTTQTLIRNNPERYAKILIDLVEKGEAVITSKANSITVHTEPLDFTKEGMMGRSQTVAMFQNAIARAIAPVGEYGVTLFDSENTYEVILNQYYEAVVFNDKSKDLSVEARRLEDAVLRGNEDTQVTLSWYQNPDGKHSQHCLGVEKMTAEHVILINPQGKDGVPPRGSSVRIEPGEAGEQGKFIISRKEFDERLVCAFIVNDNEAQRGLSRSLFGSSSGETNNNSNTEAAPAASPGIEANSIDETSSYASNALPFLEWVKLSRMLDVLKKDSLRKSDKR